jgi:nucleoside-diphosphate-sugar epimerase
MSELHVIFGAGPLGKWTARELIRQGKAVRMINRSGKANRLPPGVELIASDAYDVAQNIAVTREAAVVYQCAQPPYYQWEEKFPPLQSAILAAAAHNNARLVVGDNLYMYGQFNGILSEASPLAPNTKKGRVRAAMAQAIMEAHQTGKVKAAIGRASDFFGPDDHTLTGYAIKPAVAGKSVSLIGRTDQPHSFTYIADFGRLLATLGTREEALGQVWFAPTNPPLTQAEFVQRLAGELGRPVKYQRAGNGTVYFLSLFNKEMAEIVEMMYEWNHPFVINSEKASSVLGLQPTPLKLAIQETIAWCREQSAGQ